MLIDITKPLFNGMDVWPGDTPFQRTTKQYRGYTTSSVTMSLHSGTHMDAPRHGFRKGKPVDEIFPFVVPALVKTTVNPGGKAVLLDGPVTPEEAEVLVGSGAVLIGTSSISIDYGELLDAHGVILGAGIPVVENLEIENIEPGEYTVMVFPLKLTGADGSPVRVILAENPEDIISFNRESSND